LAMSFFSGCFLSFWSARRAKNAAIELKRTDNRASLSLIMLC
jgi:hypothetical protein